MQKRQEVLSPDSQDATESRPSYGKITATATAACARDQMIVEREGLLVAIYREYICQLLLSRGSPSLDTRIHVRAPLGMCIDGDFFLDLIRLVRGGLSGRCAALFQ